jgi:hypothetical protein
MPVYLNELQGGSDQTLIGFPHLLICMGVVVQTNAWLYGFHYVTPADTPVTSGLLLQFITSRGGDVANAVRLYGCANWSVRYSAAGNKRQAWEAEMQSIANTLGYQGKVSGFNTGIIDPQDGTYVEYVPEYPQRRCRIFYKRHEKMNHPGGDVRGGLPRSMISYRPGIVGILPNTGRANYTTGGDVIPTAGNKGQLHELNYFHRLVSFNV